MQENYHIAADALFRENKQIFTPRMSEFSIKYSKQANLLMIVGGKERHYTGIKNKTAKSKKSSSFPLLYELLLFIYIYIYIYQRSLQSLTIKLTINNKYKKRG